jgi:hypothetical protein
VPPMFIYASLYSLAAFFALGATTGEAAGLPVFNVCTPFKLRRNVASLIACRALIPARNSSLFFVGRFRFAARTFRPSSTRYSAFGIVKLSRTSLCLGFAVCSSPEGARSAGRDRGPLPTNDLTDGLLDCGAAAGDLDRVLGFVIKPGRKCIRYKQFT